VIGRVSEALEPVPRPIMLTIWPILEGMAQPTLLVVGDRDPVAPLDQVLEMFGAIPNCGLWVMPYATHVTADKYLAGRIVCALEVSRFLQRQK
jgi:3-oxoadipate enol-lactonase